MVKRSVTDEAILAQIPAARARAKQARDAGFRATSARYDRPTRRVLLELTNGVLLGVPVGAIAGLAGAADEQLGQIDLLPQGVGVEWPALNIDASIEGIVRDNIGKQIAAKALGAAGGSVSSDAKAAAARANGAKGGRPRKRAVVHIVRSKTDDDKWDVWLGEKPVVAGISHSRATKIAKECADKASAAGEDVVFAPSSTTEKLRVRSHEKKKR